LDARAIRGSRPCIVKDKRVFDGLLRQRKSGVRTHCCRNVCGRHNYLRTLWDDHNKTELLTIVVDIWVGGLGINSRFVVNRWIRDRGARFTYSPEKGHVVDYGDGGICREYCEVLF